MTDTPSGKVSPELRRAIAADVIGCFADTRRVGPEDARALRLILSGKLDPGFAVDRKRALGVLACSDPSRETAELLGRQLSSGDPHGQIAAAYLALLPTAMAEPALLAALPKASGPLRGELIKALGEVGGTAALDRLRKAQADDSADAQLKLAALEVAMREEKTTADDDLFETLEIRWSIVRAASLEAKDVRDTIQSIQGSTHSITLNPEYGLGFKCGGLNHALLLNAALKRGAFVDSLRKRPQIAGLLVVQSERLRAFATRWLLLTEPRGERVRIALVRQNGEVAFAGESEPSEKGLAFTLRDTGLERVPAEIEGLVTPDAIEWTMRLWQGPLRGKLSPRPLSLPPTRARTAA